MREWLFLIGAIVLETFATSMLKYSEQFTKLLPTIAMIVGYGLSFYLLSHALRTMPIGIAYAIWSALGIVLITLVGVIAFKQVPDLPAYIGIALIMAGVIIINLFSKMEVH
ncbi:MAG: multidrug efflux SMR transporter [Bacteroidaceae bacterium]|nr:multidrug efflux SMR transporter [Bacteroidaceae bacterium]MBR3884454.1 multidrug efflux SMR transporter [Bacteroidaceae bacterium]